MARQYQKNKFKKKQPLSSKIAMGVMLAMALGAVAKFTPVLSVLGIGARQDVAMEASLAMKRKSFDLDAAREQQLAEAKAQAERRALQKAMEEADQKRRHEEDLARDKAEEAAFNAWYKPSEQCANKSGKWETAVKCGNEYIAAKKYFLEHHPK